MIRIFMIGFSNNKGGVESYIKNLASHMDSSKFEIVFSMPQMTIDDRVWTRPKNRHKYVEYRLFWKHFFKENNFDVIYNNASDLASIDDLRFAKRAKIPVRILHSHSSILKNRQHMSVFHRIATAVNKCVIPKYATHRFACSEMAGKAMFVRSPFVPIKNGVDLNDYACNMKTRIAIRQSIGLSKEMFIGCVGRFAPAKNLGFAVDVFGVLHKKDPSVKMVMIGDGAHKQEIMDIVAEKHLESSVFFTGAVDNVNEWMSALDCLLMPSLFEGLPFVLVEAQAAGLPCVVSKNVSQEANITGLVEYVGLDESPDVWADRILSVVGKERIDTKDMLIQAGYSIEATAKKVSDIIDNALAERAR